MEAKEQACHFCSAKHGSLRPVGRFKVELKSVEIEGEEKWVCQSCHLRVLSAPQNRKKERGLESNFIKTLKNIFSSLFR